MNDFFPETTACFTGHRTIPPSAVPEIRSCAASALQQAYDCGYRTFVCGGARGFDTLAAFEVIRFRAFHSDVRLFLALPCADQADRWTEEDRALWKSVREQADEVRVLSETYYSGCMHLRDRFMVDASSLCLCWMTHFEGGTWYTVRYALRSNLKIINLAMPKSAVPVFKEPLWNYMSTSPSASESARTVRLFLSPLQRKRKMHMSKRFSGRRN